MQVMSPHLDEVQQTISRATSLVLEVSRNIAQWGQQRYRDPTPEEHKKMMELGNAILLCIVLFIVLCI